MHRPAEVLKDFGGEKRGVAIKRGFSGQRARLSTASLMRLAQLAPSRYGGKRITLPLDVIGSSAVFLVLALWKAPGILRHPRFWAEEGTVFYAGFVGKSFLECIFYIGHGSLQILSNAIVYLAAQAPVAFAPAITTYLALGLHLLVVAQSQLAVIGGQHAAHPAGGASFLLGFIILLGFARFFRTILVLGESDHTEAGHETEQDHEPRAEHEVTLPKEK